MGLTRARYDISDLEELAILGVVESTVVRAEEAVVDGEVASPWAWATIGLCRSYVPVVSVAVGRQRTDPERARDDEHKVSGLVIADIGMADLVGVGQLVVLRHVTQIGDGTCTEHLVSILLGLVPLLVVEVELRSEGLRSSRREVEDRLAVAVVVDQGDTLLEVLSDELVDLRHGEAGYGTLELRLGLREVRDTKILVTGAAVVGLTEDIDPNEVGIGTAEERFTAGGLQLLGVAEFFDGLQSLVGCTDHVIAGTPEVRLIIPSRPAGGLPEECFVIANMIILEEAAVVLDVVGTILREAHRQERRIS